MRSMTSRGGTTSRGSIPGIRTLNAMSSPRSSPSPSMTASPASPIVSPSRSPSVSVPRSGKQSVPTSPAAVAPQPRKRKAEVHNMLR